MKTMAQFEKELLDSELKLRLSIAWDKLGKDEILNRVNKLLERQTKDMQMITQLRYLEECSISEISEILDKPEQTICLYLQAIISDIDKIINNEKKEIILGNKFPWGNSEHILDVKW